MGESPRAQGHCRSRMEHGGTELLAAFGKVEDPEGGS